MMREVRMVAESCGMFAPQSRYSARGTPGEYLSNQKSENSTGVDWGYDV